MHNNERSRAHLTLVSSMPKPEAEDGYAQWAAYFERKYGRTQVNYSHAMETTYVRVWGELNKLADRWDRETQGIYDVFVTLFMMRLCDRWTIDSDAIEDYAHMSAYYGSRIADNVLERIKTAVQALDMEGAARRHTSSLKGIAEYLADGMLNKPIDSAMPWAQAYKLLWSKLMTADRRMLQDERTRLRELAHKEGASSRIAEEAMQGLACLDILTGEDENAWERIAAGARSVEPKLWFPYLTEMAANQEWDRLGRWLIWLRPSMDPAYLSQEMEGYLDFWQALYKQGAVEKTYRETLVALLPSSFWVYEAHLLDKEDYQTWADACLMLGHSPLHMEPATLKRVEKADARLLLPVYYHAIDRCLKEGNREAYKSAVKLLKKLASLHAKLKTSEQFHAYLQSVAEAYARHRAFQEELRKGKLLP